MSAGQCQSLIIGYGNTLRGDDGVGPRLAETVAGLEWHGIQALSCALLTPELAEPISRSKRVVFVDASVEVPREVRFRPLQPADSSQILAHAADPRTLLALARDVFGHVPEAWWLTIPADDLGIGETLSPKAQQGLDAALGMLRKWMGPNGPARTGD